MTIAIDTEKPIYGIEVKQLQKKLEKQNVMIHFDDKLVPDDKTIPPEKMTADEHF